MPLCQLQRARTETYFAFVRHRRTVAAPVRHSNSPHGKSNASVHSNRGHGRPSTPCVRLLSCAASSASSYTTASTSKATTSAAGRVRPERRRVWTQISPLEVRTLCGELRHLLEPQRASGLSTETKVLCALSFFATGSYQRRKRGCVAGLSESVHSRRVGCDSGRWHRQRLGAVPHDTGG